MMSIQLASAWGDNTRNTHAVELHPSLKDYEYFRVTFSARHYREALSWKLRDASGFERNLPYFCTRKEFSNLSITVYGSEGGSYKYDCTVEAWPKDLQMPIVKFHSISTVQISQQEKCTLPPIGRYRRKGATSWEIGSLITFDRLNDIYETQLFCEVKHGIIVESPILEVECMWQSFDIEKETTVNFDEILLRKNFAISINESSIYNTDYTASIKLISPIDANDYDKEITLRSRRDRIDRKDVPIILGASYEFKIYVQNFAKSFTRIIKVPATYVDKNLWNTLFGEADQVTFNQRQSKIETRWIDWYAGEGEDYETNIEQRYLVLYKHGAYSYKHTLQEVENGSLRQRSYFGGSFTLTRTNPKHMRINLLRIFAKDEKKNVSVPSVNFSNAGSQPESPAPLQIPELLNYIVDWMEDSVRLRCRQVCKMWCKSIAPTSSGLITAQLVTIFGNELPIQSDKKI